MKKLAKKFNSAKSGFALIFALLFMVLLFVLLVAAQGSVMTSMMVIQRSNQRMERSELVTSLLARSLTPAGAQPITLESGAFKATSTSRRLQSGDPTYAKVPGVAPAEGDTLLAITITGKGMSDEEEYLINPTKGRTGALRVK